MEIDCFILAKKEPKKKYDNSVLNPSFKQELSFGWIKMTFQLVSVYYSSLI
jgi:hypothetical protein